VLLMQENRSFDHYFGTLSGVRGFADPHAARLPNGKPVFYQPDAENPAGYALPFHLDTHATNAQKIPSTSHAWQVQHDAWNGGKMDSWLPAHRKADGKNGPYVMGYHTRADLPFQFAPAEAFTICDSYHCSVFGPTWPNRMMWMTGTVDPDGENGGPILDNKAPAGGYTWTTYAERLEAAGVSWKVYEQSDTYGCNMLENFANFKNAPADSPLAVNGLTHRPEGQFEYDARNDKLPTVSWIICTSTASEHPQYTPAEGAAFVASKIDAIASSSPRRPRRHPGQRPPGRRGLPRPGDRGLAVDRGRLGVQRELRPHADAAFPRAGDGRGGAELLAVAPADVRRPGRRRSASTTTNPSRLCCRTLQAR
jgi:phospholipase C